MKIQHIALGTRFLFEGEEYTKTGPMVATGKSGQRLIPRHAVLAPIGDAAPAPPAGSARETIGRAVVHDAFEVFYARCAALVPERHLDDLKAARSDFLRKV